MPMTATKYRTITSQVNAVERQNRAAGGEQEAGNKRC